MATDTRKAPVSTELSGAVTETETTDCATVSDAFTPRSMPTLTAPVTCTAAVLLLQFQPLPAVERSAPSLSIRDAVTGSTWPSVIDNTGYGSARL
ncbi:hypothetical protein D3C85_1359640 [compost metagenome]